MNKKILDKKTTKSKSKKLKSDKVVNLEKHNKLNRIKLFIKKYQKVFMVLILLAAVAGGYFLNNFIQTQRRIAIHKKVSQKQQQIMKDFWHNKGLSDEEIQAKLKSGRGNFDPSQMTDEMKQKMQDRRNQQGSDSGAIRGIMRMAH